MTETTNGTDQQRRWRVLLLAEAANPEWQSVPLIGWSFAEALRRVCDVHLVTQVRNSEAIERRGLAHGIDFTAIDTEDVSGPLYRAGQVLRMGGNRGWTTLMAMSRFSYPTFEKRAWRTFETDLRAGAFDVVHRVTPVSPTLPSPIAKRCAEAGVPFVLGPLNGGLRWPREFRSIRIREREFASYLRFTHTWMPGYAETRRHASAILCGSTDTLDQLPSWAKPKAALLPENAIDPARFTAQRAPSTDGPLRVLFVGRLVPYKGVDMLIDAIAPLLASNEATLTIVGDGPERAALEARLRSAAPTHADGVFLGRVPHEQVGERMASSDLFVSPAVREFGGGAVLEAMAVGCPPVYVAHGGPMDISTPETGFPLRLQRREGVVAELRQLLVRLTADRDLINTTGAAARTRVQNLLTWDRKAEQAQGVYEAVASSSPLPAYFERRTTGV